jgi:heat shock protein HtpX
MNTMKTTILLAALTALFVVLGNVIGGQSGMIIALVIAALMNFISYWFSDKIVLAMYKAKPVTREEAKDLYRIVEDLTQRAGLPMPKVYIIPGDSPNAFATGRDPKHAAVAVTEGLMELMNHDEIQGVIAHELSHVKHRDTLIGTVAATLAGAIMVLANMARWGAFMYGGRDDEGRDNIFSLLALAILAPIAAMLIQMAISRSREYKADDGAAHMTNNPYGLASALRKLSETSKRKPLFASRNTAHLFIVQPFSGKAFLNLFSTHPPIEERIKRLQSMNNLIS